MSLCVLALVLQSLCLGFGVIVLHKNYRAAEAELGQALDTIEWLEFEAELFRTEYYDILPLVPNHASDVEDRLRLAA